MFGIFREKLKLLKMLTNLDVWDSNNIAQAITAPAKKMNLNLGEVYSLLYTIILGKKAGPKLARLLQELDKNTVCELISQVVN